MIPVYCKCRTCIGAIESMQIFTVCPNCGNKRCPKAESHLYKCSGSNASDQIPELET